MPADAFKQAFNFAIGFEILHDAIRSDDQIASLMAKRFFRNAAATP
jgi:hypothetical protein